jgi:hypothetical protein
MVVAFSCGGSTAFHHRVNEEAGAFTVDAVRRMPLALNCSCLREGELLLPYVNSTQQCTVDSEAEDRNSENQRI